MAIVVITLLFGACKYDFILPEEIPDPNDPNTDEVKFSEQVLPIFTNNNNCTACHDTGGQIPDLTAGNAYNAINNTRYLNSVNPEQSRIYTVAHPDTDGHKQKKYTATQAAVILTWIKQGAKNN